MALAVAEGVFDLAHVELRQHLVGKARHSSSLGPSCKAPWIYIIRDSFKNP